MAFRAAASFSRAMRIRAVAPSLFSACSLVWALRDANQSARIVGSERAAAISTKAIINAATPFSGSQMAFHPLGQEQRQNTQNYVGDRPQRKQIGIALGGPQLAQNK